MGASQRDDPEGTSDPRSVKVGHGGETGQIRFLRQIVDRGAGLGKAIPLRHQSGLRSKVGLPEPLPRPGRPGRRRNSQLLAETQEHNPKGDTSVLQQKQRGRHS